MAPPALTSPVSPMAGGATPAGWASDVTRRVWTAQADGRVVGSSLGALAVLGWLASRWWLRRGRQHGAAAWRLRHARLSERLRETYMIPQTGMDPRIGLDIGGSLAKLVFIEREGVHSPFQQFIVRATRHGLARVLARPGGGGRVLSDRLARAAVGLCGCALRLSSQQRGCSSAATTWHGPSPEAPCSGCWAERARTPPVGGRWRRPRTATRACGTRRSRCSRLFLEEGCTSFTLTRRMWREQCR